MSEHKYLNSGNRFDAIDEGTQLVNNGSRKPQTQPKPTMSPYLTELERKMQIMLDKKRIIAQKALDSTVKSVSLLKESEKIGIDIAEELALQHEQLQDTNRKLDEINANLAYSQKRLNGINSVFSGFKNDYIPLPERQTLPSISSKAGTSRLDTGDATNVYRKPDFFHSHAAAYIRGLNQETISKPLPETQIVDQVDANLDEMVSHLSTLKVLGVALGKEIEEQNNFLDEIQDKVDFDDIKMGQQDKLIKKLLKK